MAIPVTLEIAKRQLGLEPDDTSKDEAIGGYIADAAAWVEEYTGHIFVARNVTESFRGFKPVMLRAWPIKADAAPGVAYVDTMGATIALPGPRLDISRGRARVSPGVGCFWPFVDAQQPFTVTVRAGYEDDDEVPGNLRRAMLILIAAYDDDREGGETFEKAEASARRLCSPFRVHRL